MMGDEIRNLNEGQFLKDFECQTGVPTFKRKVMKMPGTYLKLSTTGKIRFT